MEENPTDKRISELAGKYPDCNACEGKGWIRAGWYHDPPPTTGAKFPCHRCEESISDTKKAEEEKASWLEKNPGKCYECKGEGKVEEWSWGNVGKEWEAGGSMWDAPTEFNECKTCSGSGYDPTYSWGGGEERWKEMLEKKADLNVFDIHHLKKKPWQANG